MPICIILGNFSVSTGFENSGFGTLKVICPFLSSRDLVGTDSFTATAPRRKHHTIARIPHRQGSALAAISFGVW